MNKNHMVETQMLIRKPNSEVFQAFIDPAHTVNFWFTKSSGKLEEGKTIIWEWEMYGVSAEVQVKKIIPNQKISIKWGKPSTLVDFEFKKVNDSSTYVVIQSYGFSQEGDELVHVLKDNTAGFATVLAGLKAYMEHGLNLNLIADKYPKGVS
jgi:uncharacterized protein YndB with AHSA1/START domain